MDLGADGRSVGETIRLRIGEQAGSHLQWASWADLSVSRKCERGAMAVKARECAVMWWRRMLMLLSETIGTVRVDWNMSIRLGPLRPLARCLQKTHSSSSLSRGPFVDLRLVGGAK